MIFRIANKSNRTLSICVDPNANSNFAVSLGKFDQTEAAFQWQISFHVPSSTENNFILKSAGLLIYSAFVNKAIVYNGENEYLQLKDPKLSNTTNEIDNNFLWNICWWDEGTNPFITIRSPFKQDDQVWDARKSVSNGNGIGTWNDNGTDSQQWQLIPFIPTI
ncbi:hypothetical protein [Flavilitoribacter nigricans]|uniref:Ricin B lectin domain-containing protein n=1 Tax=Flavilitoribacter nigricans (strain ATCC 23147 / DSM 23189 / NBRC 102662 / NCIMB 1420 / SS-2) TaxID=1122177 RepID=A0A2D0NCV8_FLAN2|nr:hypothetical protein [Flavilitoribacter nigricans]PHN06206.1 hypothetical protein CRP01_11530 [Flavilitoribacter nigricans DSM 23189 = NBRC 102662]